MRTLTLRSRMKKSRSELHHEPQTMLGTILNAQVEEDPRNVILKHLNDADAMRTCLVSKGAFVAASSLREMQSRSFAAFDDLISDLGAPFIKQVDKMMHFRNLEKAFNSMFHLTIRWETKEKMKEMAGVIEKQEFKIETLKRLYKAK